LLASGTLLPTACWCQYRQVSPRKGM
jgi:hypothetical protein